MFAKLADAAAGLHIWNELTKKIRVRELSLDTLSDGFYLLAEEDAEMIDQITEEGLSYAYPSDSGSTLNLRKADIKWIKVSQDGGKWILQHNYRIKSVACDRSNANNLELDFKEEARGADK